MQKFLVAAFAALLFLSVGCQNKDGSDSHHDDKAMKASMDACPHCPGKQTANADGTCPVCKMQVAKPASVSSAADVCTKCPGVQTATADGKCSGCDAVVAAKQ
jgi:uncharacterized lipoprotein NlpE involved in copper resistance